MGNGMNKVLPGLYLGNIRDAKDSNQLSENKITHILSIHDNSRPVLVDKAYLCIPLSDSPTQNISQHFSQCNDFIHQARVNGGNVLVHCLAGVSRSVTIVVAYVMSITELGWRDSLDVVRAARTCASPNFGFQRQLLEFQHETLQEERERLKGRFPPSPYPDLDECRRLMEINSKWVMTGQFPTSCDKDESESATASTTKSDAEKSSLLSKNTENLQQDSKVIDTSRKTGVALPDSDLSKSPAKQDTNRCLSSNLKPYSFGNVKEALLDLSGKEKNQAETKQQESARM